MNVRERNEEALRSRQFGFTALSFWASLGFALEAAHALKWTAYLDHPLRRELLTWAHAHGLGLALVVLAYAAVGIHPKLSSSAGSRLRAGAAAVPFGFFLSVFGLSEADPGPAIFAVPVGALLCLSSLVEIALALRGERSDSLNV